MNVWFVAYALACVNVLGWFSLASGSSSWRVPLLMLAGYASSIVIAVAMPVYLLSLDSLSLRG